MNHEETKSGKHDLMLVTIPLSLGLLSLGILIGTLLAMSAQSLAKSVIAALFALFGGSLLTFLQKVPIQDQFKASVGILAISVGTMIGIYSGLYVNEYRLLSPPALRPRVASNSKVELAPLEPKYSYLRASDLDDLEAIDQKYRTQAITAKDAYEQLRSHITSKEVSPHE